MKEPLEQFGTVAKLGDAVAVGVAGSTLIGLLPAVAAVLSIIWTVIRIYETKTVQRILCKYYERICNRENQ